MDTSIDRDRQRPPSGPLSSQPPNSFTRELAAAAAAEPLPTSVSAPSAEGFKEESMSSKTSSDPADLEKGVVTGLSKQEEDKGIPGLKEEEEEEKGITGLEGNVMCIRCLLDVCSVLFFVTLMFMALCFYKQFHIWWPFPILLSFAIFNFWNICRHRMKHSYIQQTLASTDSDLSTTLLASSSKK